MEMESHAASRFGVPRAPFEKNAPLVEPQVRRSANGELTTRLRVGYTYKDLGGYRLSLRSYEQDLPGPTLRVKRGDVLRVRLVNDLPPNTDPAPLDMTLPHQFNSTNFHFHGGHVSPSGIADNIFRVMEPGQGYDIEIAIPKDHTAGTYWYHPHKHGSADVQLTSGMAGALIIEGDFDDIPEIAAAGERVLILNEVLFDHRGAIENYDTVWPEAVPRFLSVNGQREPAIRMRPGEVQRWRVLHAGHENNFHIALEGHGLNVIAYDGIRSPRIDRSESLLMAPGQRADILVQAGAAGSYALRAIANDQGYPSPQGPLARLIVEGEPMDMRLPATLGGAPFQPISARGGDQPARGDADGGRAGIPAGGELPGIRLPHLRATLRSEPGRPPHPARRRRRMDRDQRPQRRPYLPHPHQSVPGHVGERPGTGRAGVARYGGGAAERAHRVPLALPRFHRPLRPALPHDEP